MASAGLNVVKVGLVRFHVLLRHVHIAQHQGEIDQEMRSMASFR